MRKVFTKRGPVLLFMLLLMLFAAIPGMAEEAVQAVAPKSVKLSSSKTIKVPIGSQYTLTPTLSPENATTTYSWKTANKKIATVSGGVVTAKKVGTAKITVTTANKKKSSVNIKVYDPYLPTSVKLDQSGTVKLPLGETLTLTPTLSPATAQSGFTWKSSKKKIASVSNGVVTAKKTGTTKITVTTRNKKKASVKIKVYDPTLPTSVKLNLTGTQTLMVSNGLLLQATMSPATAVSDIKWKSSNKKVACVDQNGYVGGLAPGTTKITATTARNKKVASVKIKVMDDGKQPILPPPGYDLPYVVYACKNTHTVAIIAKDDNGDWTRVIRMFPTGMGKKNVTDVGFFALAKKERWHKWGSTSYSPYACKLSVGIFIHGPIYKSKNANTMKASTYNVIGTDCSSGCLRTISGCAAWIYYNCPIGTMVVVAQNSRFSTPRPAKVSSKATSDPTDPGANPEILITGFTVDKASLELTEGMSDTLTAANFAPANNSTGNAVSFVTSDGNVATVSNDGIVTAVGPGVATIYVVANDDFRYTVAVPVTVAAAPEPVEAVAEVFEAAEAEPEAEDEDAFDIEDDGLTADGDEEVPEEAFEIVIEEVAEDTGDEGIAPTD